MRSVSTVSSEEGEASEYPSSQRSTLESNPEKYNLAASVPALNINSSDILSDDSTEEEEDDDGKVTNTARDTTVHDS